VKSTMSLGSIQAHWPLIQEVSSISRLRNLSIRQGIEACSNVSCQSGIKDVRDFEFRLVFDNEGWCYE